MAILPQLPGGSPASGSRALPLPVARGEPRQQPPAAPVETRRPVQAALPAADRPSETSVRRIDATPGRAVPRGTFLDIKV